MLGIVNVKENEYLHARFGGSLYLIHFTSKKNLYISNIQTSISRVTRPRAFKWHMDSTVLILSNSSQLFVDFMCIKRFGSHS